MKMLHQHKSEYLMRMGKQACWKFDPMFSINDAVMGALKIIRATISSAIRIDCQHEARAHIEGNQTQIYQVIVNLCTNAAQAMPEDQGTIKISLDRKIEDSEMVRSSSDYIRLSITDNGAGIAPEKINSVQDAGQRGLTALSISYS